MVESFDLKNYLRPSIAALKPYRSAASESSASDPRARIKLDANENPRSLNQDPLGIEDHRYPDPTHLILREKLAAFYGVKADEVLMTRGIDEGIDILLRSFCEPAKDSILIHPPTYGYYEVCAGIQNCGVRYAPLESDFSLNVSGIEAELEIPPKLIFLCNPNNPTGNLLQRREIEAVLQAARGRALVVLDEAYIEFSVLESFSGRIHEYPHLIVLRTFSKAWGLAGLRMGAILAQVPILEALAKVIAPYPLSRPALRALESTLRGEGWERMCSSAQSVQLERESFAGQLKLLSGVEEIFRSATNFLLVRVAEPSRLVSALRAEGISIRDRSKDVSGCIRISIGTAKENAVLLEALRERLT